MSKSTMITVAVLLAIGALGTAWVLSVRERPADGSEHASHDREGSVDQDGAPSSEVHDTDEELAEQAREASDQLVASIPLTEGTSLRFARVEVRADNVLVHYDKVFEQPRKESPATIVIAYDPDTKQAALVRGE